MVQAMYQQNIAFHNLYNHIKWEILHIISQCTKSPPPPPPHPTTPPSHPFSSRYHNITHHTLPTPHIHPLTSHTQFSPFITCFITHKYTPTHPYYPFPPIHPPSLSRYFFAGYHTHSNSGDHPTCFESNSFIPLYLISVGCMRLEVNRRKESDGRGRG